MASNKFGVRNSKAERSMSNRHAPHKPSPWLECHHPVPPSFPDSDAVDRFTHIKDNLADISESVDIRNQLIRIGQAKPGMGLDLWENQEWMRQALVDEDAFLRAQRQVASFTDGKFPSKRKLKELELQIEPVLERTKNRSNDKAHANLRNSQKLDAAGIFKANAAWNWESATGSGPGEEEAVSPMQDKMNPHEDAGMYTHLYDREGEGLLEEYYGEYQNTHF